MNEEFILSEQEAEGYVAHGFGKTKTSDASGVIRVWINIRRDREIPDFDAVSEIKYYQEGMVDPYADLLCKMVSENMGMFLTDALKLEDRDIFSMAGENRHPKDHFPILVLRAFRKAIYNYFSETGQEERLRKATERIICKCRNVSDTEINDAIKRGMNTFELVKNFTGAGSGCESCVKQVQMMVERK